MKQTFKMEFAGRTIATLIFPAQWLPSYGTLLVVKGKLYRAVGMNADTILLTTP